MTIKKLNNMTQGGAECDILYISTGMNIDGSGMEYKIAYEPFEGMGRFDIGIVSPILKEVQIISPHDTISTGALRLLCDWVDSLPDLV